MAMDATQLLASQLAGFTNAAPGGPGAFPAAPTVGVPGPFAGTPQGNVENMMLGLLGSSSISQGMMMNFINEMFTSYDKLAKSYMGMLGAAVKPPAK